RIRIVRSISRTRLLFFAYVSEQCIEILQGSVTRTTRYREVHF
ncbi:unnamed protein product, partial [Callosobruchus maculatus]